ncbi:MAG TPA: metal ABC transporter permease [Candidatus Paceibacterota bacterium]|nr:metal ABC transporter permease [Candidatus Paceibacterota bacterium]
MITFLELLRQPFVENAFFAGTLIAVVSGVVGYFVVLRAQAFAAHALSHVGFAGATLAALVGISGLLGMSGFTVAAALGMGALGKRIRGRDVEIGMILSFALGLGVLFLSLYTNSASETVSVLFGSILSVTSADIFYTVVFGALALVALAIIFRPLLFSSIDPEVAEARGVPTRAISLAFMIILAITIASAIQVVGVLLVFALIVAPAAAAQHVSRKPFSAIVISVALGVAFTWGGLLLALATSWPVSFYIAALAAGTYFTAIKIGHRAQPHAKAAHAHPGREVHPAR